MSPRLSTKTLSGKPIKYQEYYLPKQPVDVGPWGPNCLIQGSDGSWYVTETLYGDLGSPAFIQVTFSVGTAIVSGTLYIGVVQNAIIIGPYGPGQ